MKNRFLVNNPPMTALLGSLLGGGFVWLINTEMSPEIVKYGTYGITALITLLASSFAWAGVMMNLDHQRVAAEENRIRELNAARALLPATLSELSVLAELAFQTCLNIEAVRKDQETASQTMSLIRLGDQTQKNLQDCIRHTDGIAKEWLILIPSYLQIFTARLDGKLFTKGLLIMEGQAEHSSLDWLAFKAIVSHLFDFARSGEQPSNELDSTNFSPDISINHSVGSQFHDASAKYSQYVSDYGGWTASGFQSRLSKKHNFPP